MKKLWRVARYEYARNVFKRSFILALLSVPLVIALNVGVCCWPSLPSIGIAS